MNPSDPLNGPGLGSTERKSDKRHFGRLGILAAAVLLLAGAGYAASRILERIPTTTNSPSASSGPVASPVSPTEQSKLASTPLRPTLLQVTELVADRAQLGVAAATSLQLSGDLVVGGNGSFTGIVTAANFQGNGAGVTNVDAALLNGRPGSFYQSLSNLTGTLSAEQLPANVALRNAANTFTADNNFTGATTFTGAIAAGSASIAALTLGAPLAVASGGTGLTNIAAQGVMYGQTGGSLGVAAPAGAGLCLMSGATDVTWGVCGGGGAGVASVNGLTGVLNIANASGAGSTITINDASTAAKGIASFNAANFSVSSGAVNTIQNIGTGASPTFAGLTAPTVNTNAITPSAALTIGAVTQALTMQGSTTTITATSGANTTTLNFQAPTANVTYRLLTTTAGSYDICTTAGNCVGTGGGVSTTGGTTNTLPKFTGAQTLGDSLVSDNGTTVTIGGALSVTGAASLSSLTLTTALTVGNGGTGATSATAARGNLGAAASGANADITSLSGLTTALSVGQGGTGATSLTANGVVIGQGTSALTSVTAGGTGLCLMSTVGAPAFQACPGGGGVLSLNSLTGALSIANASSAGSTITIDDATTAAKGIASFNSTNFTVSSGAVNTIQNIATTSTPTFAGVNTTAITPGAALTVGATGQSFTIQGNASSVFTATNGANTTTVSFQSPTANVTYRFLAAAAGTYDICTTAGNCVGTGGGVTTSGGTTNTLAKFTGSQTLGDSLISDNGTTVTVGGTLSVNTITPTGAFTVGATAQNLTLQGATVNLTATSGGTTNALTFATPSGGAKTITLPNATGTVAVSASGPLALDSAGNLTCATCLTSGGGSGVVSLNSLTGTLTIANASTGGSTITINDATTAAKGIASFNSTNFSVSSGAVNTIQNINTGATPTFAGVNTNAITPSAALTLGATAQQFTLQGNASSTITATGGGFTTTVGFTGTPTGAVTYNFDRAATAGTYSICTTAGNCTGTGGGVTTPGGSTNAIAKFTAGQVIGDSTLTDDGTTVSTSINLTVQGGDLTIGTTSQAASLLLHDGDGQTTTLQAGDSTGNLTFILPTSTGATNQCLKQSGTGNQLFWDDCDGGAGGSSGVTSLNSLTGALTIANASTGGSTITINDATTAAKGIASFNSTNFSVSSGAVNTIQNIATTSTPTFAGISLTGAGTGLAVTNNATIGGTLGVTGNLTTSALLTANSGSISTSLNVGGTTSTDALSVTNNAGVGGTLNVTGAGGIIIGNASTAGLLSFRDGTSSFGAAFQAATLTVNRTITVPDADGTLAVSASAPLALSAAGNLTISDATTAAKGVASFNSTNFSVSSGAVNTIQNINTGATPTFAGVNTNAITPSAALSIGATGQSFTLQGNASSTITATGGGFTTTVGFTGSPTGAVTYNFDRAATPGTYTVCSTIGNCAGLGGGVTTAGGTTNRLSKFTAAGAIGNSSVLDNGSSLTLDSNVDVLLQGATAYISNPQGQTNSEAFGLNAAVAGANSLAAGNGANTHASGNSTAIGYNATGGANAAALGYNSNAQGNAVALGNNAFADSASIAIGRDTSAVPNSIALGRDTATTAANQFVVGSTTNNEYISQVYIGSGITHTAPVGFTLQGTGGSGSNVAGASVNLASGRGTGSAAGGTINLQVSSAGGTGSTLNPLSTVASFSSTAITLSRNTTVAANQNLVFADGSGQLQLDSDGEVYFREQGSTDTDLLEAFARAGYVFYTNTGQDVLEVSQNGLTTIAAGTDAFGGLLVTQSNGNPVFGVSTAGGEGSVGVGYASDGQATPFYLDADASSDPTGGKGAMYYNASTDKFRCYQNTGWTDCIAASTVSTLQQAYTASTGSTTPEIKLDSTRKGIDIQDANTTIGSGEDFITFRSANGSGLGNIVYSVGIQGNLFMQPAANRTDLIDINDNGGNNLLTLDSSNDRIGFNLGGTNTPNLTGNGVDIKGALKLSGSGSSSNFDQNCATPGATNLPARLCIASDDNAVGFFGSIAQMGLTSSANSQPTGSVLSLFDGRTVTHSLTLRVYSPDESKLVGFNWDGVSTLANVQTDNKATGDTAGLRVKTGDTAGTSNSSGTLTITSGDGLGTNTSSGNVVIDTGTKTGTGTTGTISLGTSNASSVTAGSTSGSAALTLQAGTGNINLNASTVKFTETAGTRTLSVATRSSNAAGTNLLVQGGNAGSGASPFAGGDVTIQAGSAAGTGSEDGGDIVLQSGDRVGSGDAGHVIVKSGTGDGTTDPFFQVQKSSGDRAFAVYTGAGPGHVEVGGTVSNVSYDLTFSADNAAADRTIGVDDSDATDPIGDGKNLILHAGSTSVTNANGGSIILSAGDKNGTGTAGGVTVKNAANTTNAFRIQNAAATLTLFAADTTNNRLQVGSATADSTAVLLIVDNYNTLSDPTGVPGAIYYNEASESFRCAEAERWTDCLGVPKPNTRRWTYITYPGSGTAFDANGDIYGGNTGNAVSATTSEPGMLDYGTAASTNSASSIEGNLNYNTSSNPGYQSYMALTNTANARVWAGLTDQTAATMAASDNPAGNYAAFRYSTAASDTNYKCITKDGTTQTITDSGVAPGTGGHKFEIIHLSSGQTTFKIDGGWVCANTTHLPSSSTMTRYVNTITTLTNAVRSIRVGWVYIESNK